MQDSTPAALAAALRAAATLLEAPAAAAKGCPHCARRLAEAVAHPVVAGGVPPFFVRDDPPSRPPRAPDPARAEQWKRIAALEKLAGDLRENLQADLARDWLNAPEQRRRRRSESRLRCRELVPSAANASLEVPCSRPLPCPVHRLLLRRGPRTGGLTAAPSGAKSDK